MQFFFLALLAVGSYLGAEPPGRSRPQNDLQNIEGTWQVESTHGLSSDALKEEMKTLRLTIRRDKMLATYGNNKTAEATFKLSPEKDPPEMDVTLAKGPEDARDAIGKTFHGIYMLQGNTLKIAYRNPEEKRPSSFRLEGEPGVYVVVLR